LTGGCYRVWSPEAYRLQGDPASAALWVVAVAEYVGDHRRRGMGDELAQCGDATAEGLDTRLLGGRRGRLQSGAAVRWHLEPIRRRRSPTVTIRLHTTVN
jgi:hypothetical protein